MLGVCYYPEHWSPSLWASDAKEMRALGLRYVRIGEFAWSRIEPEDGKFNFAWLDNAIDVLASEGLKIIMCPPTATPPRWVVNKYPDMLAVDIHTGLQRGFGSRRHYDFSSVDYRREAMRITKKVAMRYGNHAAVVGWQSDNELACHDTAISASENAKQAFQHWCQDRYGTITALNRAWGNVFWSMEYTDFKEIDVPYFAVTEPNPSHSLAFRRFSSDQVVAFHNEMVAIIRAHSPNRWVTHNFIPMSDTQSDNYALAKPLDFASFDNYPLGRTDLFFADAATEQFRKYIRTGHPDFSSYYFDQTRGLCQTNFWVMEQQPGPVNWATHNPRPEPGMVAFWSWVAFAHGADAVCYFRWRQAAFAQEQMHAGLKRVDNSKARAFAEVESVQQLLAQLDIHEHDPLPEDVAIVSATENQWVSEIELQGASFKHEQVEFEYYSALRQLGIQVSFVGPDMPLDKFKLIVVPCMPILSDAFIERCRNTQAIIVFGPRTGSKTEEFQAAANLAPGKLQSLIDVKVLTVETLRGDIQETMQYQDSTYNSNRWREELSLETTVNTLASYENGEAAIVRQGNIVYAGTLSCETARKALLTDLAVQAGIEVMLLPEDIRIAKRGKYGFIFNYSNAEHRITGLESKTFVYGSDILAPYSFAVFSNP